MEMCSDTKQSHTVPPTPLTDMCIFSARCTLHKAATVFVAYRYVNIFINLKKNIFQSYDNV
jgi:hypothetical protein